MSRSMLLAVCFVAGLAGAGCSVLQDVGDRMRIPPRAEDGAYESSKPRQATKSVDITDLVQRRMALGDPPVAPRPPKPVQEPSSWVNTPVNFKGTQGWQVPKGSGLAVMGGELLVGSDSTAGRFVSDLMYVELQKRGVQIRDRDYRISTRNEEQEVISGDVVIRNPEKFDRVVNKTKRADYMVVVHRVEVPNSPLMRHLPWYIPEQDWQAYLAASEEYRNAVEAYNTRLSGYKATIKDFARQHSEDFASARGIAFSVKDESPTTDTIVARLVQEIESRVRSGETTIKAMEAVAFNPDLAGSAGGLQYAQWMANAARVSTGGPQMVDPGHAIFTDQSQLLGDTNPVYLTSVVPAFQVGVSVRVLDAATSDAVWFGIAMTQDESYTAGLERCCREIVQQLIAGSIAPVTAKE